MNTSTPKSYPHDDVLGASIGARTLELPAQVIMQQGPSSQPQHSSAPATAPAAIVAVNPFADPTALGLFGLAIGCASLLPLAFGVKAAFTPDAIRMTAWFCLLFGAGCHPVRHVAVLRALTEAAQARNTYIAGARDEMFPPRTLWDRYIERALLRGRPDRRRG